jgi:hypothetical protein
MSRGRVSPSQPRLPSPTDPYGLLGLPPGTPLDRVHAAHDKLVATMGRDERIEFAYEVLADEGRRSLWESGRLRLPVYMGLHRQRMAVDDMGEEDADHPGMSGMPVDARRLLKEQARMYAEGRMRDDDL